jgi:hypothetical protein
LLAYRPARRSLKDAHRVTSYCAAAFESGGFGVSASEENGTATPGMMARTLSKNSRIRFGRNRQEIEERIARFLAPSVHSRKR